MGGLNLGPSFGAGGAAEGLFKLLVERRVREMEEQRLGLQRRAQDLNEQYRRDSLAEREQAHRDAADARAETAALRRVALQTPGSQVPAEQLAEDTKYGLGGLYEPFVGPLRPGETGPATFKGTWDQQQALEAKRLAHERIDASTLNPNAKQLAHADVDLGKGLPASVFEDPAAEDARAIRRSVEVHRQTQAIDANRPFRITPQDRLAAARAAKQDAGEWYKAAAGPSGKVVGADGKPVSLEDVEGRFKTEYLAMLEQGEAPAPGAGGPILRARAVGGDTTPAPGGAPTLRARAVPNGGTPSTGTGTPPPRVRVFSVDTIKQEMRKVIEEARTAAGDTRAVSDRDVQQALANPKNEAAVIARLRGGR